MEEQYLSVQPNPMPGMGKAVAANGGLDFNTAGAAIKTSGISTPIKFSSGNLNIDPENFKGFTYRILRLEKMSGNEAGF